MNNMEEIRFKDIGKYNIKDIIVVETLTFIPQLKCFIRLISYFVNQNLRD
jgi:hypothetical protein